MLTMALRDVTRRIPHADPVAMELLTDGPELPAPEQLGAFPKPGDGGNLGFFGLDIALVTKAIPVIQGIIRGVQGGAYSGDPVAAVWMALPASAINARVGADGWWYDISTGAKLSHEEAAQRQQQVVAKSIGAHVGPDGWWYDDRTNQQLSHQDAINRYDALVKAGSPMVGAPTTTPKTQPMIGAPGTQVAGVSKSMLYAGAALAALFVLPAMLGKRRRSA